MSDEPALIIGEAGQGAQAMLPQEAPQLSHPVLDLFKVEVALRLPESALHVGTYRLSPCRATHARAHVVPTFLVHNDRTRSPRWERVSELA